MDWILLGDWLEFAIRWTHVITAIAWIGSSFYFIALDLGLRPSNDRRAGVSGEAWQVHGGGFYNIQKYMVAPDRLPEDLTWFKWESYATWLTGFAMLVLVYHVGAEFYLVDPDVMDLPVWAAIGVSVGSLAIGWLAYDAICRSPFGADNRKLMIGPLHHPRRSGLAYAQVFSGRAALLHLGALTATVMSGNVFLVIIPNQKVVVADLIAGRVPDAKYGQIAKQRSTHNNYLTLPVIFLMLSNHYPLAFATGWNWMIASLVFLMGVTIRHYFNTIHARKGQPNWTWVVTALLFAAIIWLSQAPGARPWLDDPYPEEEAALNGTAARYAAAPGFADVADIVLGRCSMCHAAEPGWDGLGHPPKGVRLDTPGDVARHARRIYLQAGLSRAMPPGNVSYMEPAERAAIVAWVRAAEASPGG